MPSYAPRSEPIKKKEQLAQKANELLLAINKKNDTAKIDKLVDKYRLAQLSMIKANIHVFHDKEFQKKATTLKIEKLERQLQVWETKSRQEIIDQVRSETHL